MRNSDIEIDQAKERAIVRDRQRQSKRKSDIQIKQARERVG